MLLSDHPVSSELATTASDRVLGPHAPAGVVWEQAPSQQVRRLQLPVRAFFPGWGQGLCGAQPARQALKTHTRGQWLWAY